MIDLDKSNSEKIVKQALSFERPDRLPVFDGFWEEFEENWRKLQDNPNEADIEDYYWPDLMVLVAKEEFFPTRMGQVKQEGDDIYINDGWGRIVRRKQGTYFAEPEERILNKPSDLDSIEFDSPVLDVRYDGFVDQVDYHRGNGRAVFVKIGGIFIRSTYFRGEVEFLMDLAGDKAFAKAIVEKVGSHLLQIGLESLKRADAYDCGVWIYDDMCNINSPMFSPQIFEEIFLPVYKRVISTLKLAGAKWVFLHCDGNLGPLLDMLIEAGIDGINPVEASAGLDVVKLAEKYHGQLSFIGGVCNTHVLPSGDPERIRRHIEPIVDAAKNGGLIIGTHSVGPDISVESYELYRKIVKERF
jgi:uroporphyrinogen decarboxylase